ncbi:MAG: leucine-rich repeat protein [Muribaculaceae bacterium]|nr:leucine-rich repeat protein [Muribaculaceae bacterium]
MKTHNIRILFFIVQFFLGVGLSEAVTISYEGLNYNTLSSDDGTREVELGINFDLPSSTLRIPAEVENEAGEIYRVVGIGANALYTNGGRNAIVNLEIADNPYFRYIGDNSFRLCSKLKGISFGSLPALERIGNNSFESCSLLSEINLENATNLKFIGNKAFYQTAISDLDLSSNTSLTSIGEEAFRGCSFGCVTIKSDDLKSLGKYVFAENTALSVVNIESGALTSTGNYTFYNCTSLSEVNLKCEALEEIGTQAFDNCGSLATFNIDESGNIMYIRSEAFYNCGNLPFSLDLVPKLRRIENRAFYNAKKFTKNNLDFHVTPDLEYLGSNAFYGATFTEVDLSDHERGLRIYWTFQSLNSLRKVNLSNCPGLTMEGRVFYECTNLQSLDLTGSGPITEISDDMFYHTNLSDFKIDYSAVTKIGNSAFKYSKIKELDLSKAEKLTEIGPNAFAHCSMSIVKLPASLEKLYNSAFEYTTFDRLVCFAPEPPIDPNEPHDATIREPFYSSQMLKKGVLYVPIESVKKYKAASIWKDIPVIRPFGYYENMSLPEKCEAYVGAEKEISISWMPEEAPFPGKVEWYIKEQDPDKFAIADLTPSAKPESVIVEGYLPGEYTLVARVRVEKEDKDEYVELESPLVIEYCPMEVVFKYPEYTFSGPRIDKWFGVSTIPEGVPMNDVWFVSSNPEVAIIWEQWGEGMWVMSSSPGTTDVYAMRNDEVLGKMTIRVQADRITSIKCDKDFLEICPGNSSTMSIIPDEPDFANPGDLTWTVKSGSEHVEMEVSEDTWSASFKGISTGEAVVEVKYNYEIKTTFKVYVIDGDVERVITDSESYTVRMNNDLEIFPSTAPVVFPATAYTYTIKDEEIAQIIENEEGQAFIHPLSIGKTELRVSLAANPDLFATADIEVIAETPLTEILIEGQRHPMIEMMEGEIKELSLSIDPLDASDARFRWSTDASAAQLQMEPSDDSQKVTIEALKSGRYLLSATALDGSGLTATAEISVGRIEPVSVKIIQPENDIIVGDDSQSFKAVIDPENASETLLAWNVSDENILTLEEISNDEVRIHPHASGTTVVFVMMTQDPWLMDMAVVKVWNKDEIRSISFAEEDLMLGMGGAPYKLTPVVAPADAEIPLLIWESTNENVAIVDENGYVSAVAPGSTVIRVKVADNPELTATCKVMVSAMKIEDLSLDKEEVEIVEGWSEIVTASFSNTEAYPELKWSVSDPDIAEITAYPFTNGVRVEGLMPGECELKVICEGLTAVCKVIVLPRPPRNIAIRMPAEYLALGSPGMEATIDYDHEELGRPDVVWSSSNESVARIEDMGDGTVRIIPVNAGECEIRVEETDLPDSYDVRGITVGYTTGVSGIFTDDDAEYDLFDINGRVLRLGAKVSEIKQLTPGIYLLRRGDEMIKIIIG